MTIAALILFGVVVLWMSVYGYVVSSKTSEDYMLAGRGIGILVMFFFMLFSISSAWTFYGYPGYLYTHGPCYVFFVWGCVAGFAALYMPVCHGMVVFRAVRVVGQTGMQALTQPRR